MNPAQKLKTAAILPTHTPLELLRLLAKHGESIANASTPSSAKEVIRTSIYLNGASFSGYVAGMREEGEASFLLFIEQDDSSARGINTIYLPSWAVVAVKVHDADQFLHLLSGGKIEAQQSGPGIMGLRRKIADEVVRLRTLVQTDIRLEVSWETLTQDDLSLLGLYELIDCVMAVVVDLISDEFKRIAFKTIISIIRFQNAQDAELILDEQILIIRADLKAREEGRFSKEELAEAIASIL